MISNHRNENIADPTRHRENPVAGVVSSASEVAGDFVELAELQVKLVRADLKAAINHAIWPLGFVVIGTVIGVAALPSITIGLALLLDSQTQLALWASQLIVGSSLIVVAIVMILIAVRSLRNAFNELNTSTAELAKNVAWIKEVVRGNGKR
jgi:uncharacterized membrane protein YqjE